MSKTTNSIWNLYGQDTDYEAYRANQNSQQLRDWVDQAYTANNLSKFLDKDFLDGFRNRNFYGRLWELEVAEWLKSTGLALVPTNGTGPDFCLELPNKSRIWVEAVLSKPDETLIQEWNSMLASNGNEAHEVPRKDVVLRYTSNLFEKAEKIKKSYLKLFNKSDYVLIAISGFSMPSMWSDIDLFLPAVLPIEYQVIYFSKDGTKAKDSNPRPTHTEKREYQKSSGSSVPKEFLYPGTMFSHIDGVIFSEASNIQQLLGRHSSGFNDSTNCPHIFSNFSGRKLPTEFTKHFYYHKFSASHGLASIKVIRPK